MADFDVKPSVIDRVRDRPRRLQRLAVLIVILGMGLALLYPLLRDRHGAPIEVRDVPRLPPENLAVIPLAASPTDDPRRVALGRRLFFDARLSPLGRSCGNCHVPASYGTLRAARSPGLGDQLDEFNVPTVLNAALSPYLGWKGKTTSLADQLHRVINNPRHMGSNWAWVIETLSADSDYRSRFSALYADGITRSSITDAILAFERSLVTPGAPFDRYLRGEFGALTSEQIAGYELFKDYGCIACHQGRNLGGNLIIRFGILEDPFKDGFFDAATPKSKRFLKLRVPSLRNVAKTGPYLHDGSVETLEEVVRLMARYQLGREMPEEDVRRIVAFLHSLTAPLPENFR